MDNTTGHQFQNPSIKGLSKAVLVTGGAGYVGSHTCKYLAKNGFTPITIDRDLRTKHKPVNFGPSFDINLPQEIERLEEVIKRFNITSCIHFAGSASVAESVKNPSEYYKNNVIATVMLLDKLIEFGVKTFVYSSSAATYGIPDKGICYDTEKNLHPINPYGKTKLMIEKILQDYWTAYHVRSISLRFFNVGGADLDNEIGESHEVETHIIPLAIQAGFNADEFYLFGDNYNTPDGTCLRDYVHVVDVAEAHLQAVRLISEKIACDSFNIGSGKGTSNMQILDEVQRHTGAMDIVKSPKRAGDPDQLIADISRTTEQLNWKPINSSIDKIVQTAVQWYKHNHRKDIN